MTDNISYISIPSDEDGFVQLKCPSCSEKFMLQIDDIENGEFIDIWCPNCGLKHENYLDDDIEQLAESILHNKIADLINGFSIDIEKSLKNSKSITFKPGKQIKKESENPISKKVGDLNKISFRCCGNIAKISSIKEIEGGYCPFCGEIFDGN